MEYHGSMKSHRLMMEYGWNVLIKFIMNAIHFASRMELLYGLLVIRRRTDIATLVTCMYSFVTEIQFAMKIMSVMDHCKTQEEQGWFDEHEIMEDDDDDISDLEDYLIQKDPPYYVNEEEERSKERRCKIEKFEVVKYSFGPAEKYVAITEYEYDIWGRIKENILNLYQDIFHKRNKGWFVSRTK
ncbi:hypothetical protein Tco_0835599 [Tanacetum coccineum]